ncbi:hypothetical protein THTE_0081 [Thermogutta terrifontis]|uniref:Uncharacterized protein n=1 Tax=Thermogutta terrifontis TaxID=1331910 RepID=A0A286R9Q9_9BACT|nr:hypothetical protein THTE_0081 [Thermogutta terrifontis]
MIQERLENKKVAVFGVRPPKPGTGLNQTPNEVLEVSTQRIFVGTLRGKP